MKASLVFIFLLAALAMCSASVSEYSDVADKGDSVHDYSDVGENDDKVLEGSGDDDDDGKVATVDDDADDAGKSAGGATDANNKDKIVSAPVTLLHTTPLCILYRYQVN